MDVDTLVIVTQGEGVNVITRPRTGDDWKAWKLMWCSFYSAGGKVRQVLCVFAMARKSGLIVLKERHLSQQIQTYIYGQNLKKTMLKGVIKISMKMTDSYMMCVFSSGELCL